MKSKYILLLNVIFYLFYSCKENNTGFNINLNSEIDLDTNYVSELITRKPVAKIQENKEIENALIAK